MPNFAVSRLLLILLRQGGGESLFLLPADFSVPTFVSPCMDYFMSYQLSEHFYPCL